MTWAQLKEKHIVERIELLERHKERGVSKAQGARDLGISRHALENNINRLGIDWKVQKCR